MVVGVRPSYEILVTIRRYSTFLGDHFMSVINRYTQKAVPISQFLSDLNNVYRYLEKFLLPKKKHALYT